MIDLNDVIQPEATFAVVLKHPATGARLGPEITVYGMDSAEYRRASHTQRSRRFKNMKPGKMAVTPEEIEEDALELLAACTAGWKDVTYKGELMPFNAGNALKLYREVPWLREQVDEAIADRGNFSRESEKDS